jgi:hypothetical protein
MAKCYVRLELKDADLHLSVRTEMAPPNGAPNPPWSAWMTYVFVRG